MKITRGGWAVCLLAYFLVEDNFNVCVGFQEKVTAALEFSSYALQEVTEYQNKLANTLEESSKKATDATKALARLNSQKLVLKLARSCEKLLKGLQAIGAIASFIFAIFLPSDTDQILDEMKKRFDEVNLKLDLISMKLTDMTKEIKSSVEFNNFLTSFNKWENDIINGGDKLVKVRKQIASTKDRKRVLKLAEDFINYVDSRDIEGKMKNIYRSATQPGTTTRKNFFEIFIKEHGCHVNKLVKLFILLNSLVVNAAGQMVTYYNFKGRENEAKEIIQNAQKHLYEIRYTFDTYVMTCMDNSITYAEEDAKGILIEYTQSGNEYIAKLISDELKENYPWFSWSVVILDTLDNSERLDQLKVFMVNAQEFENNFRIDNKGSSFLMIRDHGEKKKNMIIVWQDAELHSNCHSRMKSDTVVFYPCKGCTNDRLVTGNNMLSSDVCNHVIFKPVPKAIPANIYYLNIKWIAAITPKGDPCIKNTCGNHGTCNEIPYIGKAFCICQALYDGDFCENHVVIDNTIDDLIGEFRDNFYSGVPSSVDIYFEIHDLSKNLDKMMDNIKTFHEYGQEIAKHAQYFHQASYIAQQYNKLQDGTITLKEFGSHLDVFFTSVSSLHYLLTRIKEILLGQSFFNSERTNFVNIYKKYISKQLKEMCTKTYNTKVLSILNNLAVLDQAISEASLVHLKLKSEKVKSPKELDDMKAKAVKLSDDSIKRQKEYWSRWITTSCPILKTEGMINEHCSEYSSFEGMVVNVKCANHRKPKHSSIKCISVNGKLKWDKTPRCEYYWSSWTSWSKCTKSCGGGTQTRKRNCVGNNAVKCNGNPTESRVCGSESCCQSKYGNFKCKFNGKCIARTKLCDGNDDCGDLSDESKQICPNLIYDGDTIALRNIGKKTRWLSCYCTVNCGYSSCKLRTCPGHEMYGGDWDRCTSEQFRIHALNRRQGEPIRSGDRIGLQYAYDSSKHDYGYWLSCWGSGSSCTTRTCPGEDLDYNDSNCLGELFWIVEQKGMTFKPIKTHDTVFFKYSIKNYGAYWVSGIWRHYQVKTMTCPGFNITPGDTINCDAEAWMIYRNN